LTKHDGDAKTPEFAERQADASIDVRLIIGLQNDATVDSDLSINLPVEGYVPSAASEV
jgi:hypothetical protein